MTKMKGQKTMGTIIMVFIIGLIGVVFLSTIATEIEGVRQGAGNSTNPDSNVTGSTLTITQLVPLFFVLVILFVFVTAIMGRMRRR